MFSGQGPTPFYNSGNGSQSGKIIQKGWNNVAGAHNLGSLVVKGVTLQQHTFIY